VYGTISVIHCYTSKEGNLVRTIKRNLNKDEFQKIYNDTSNYEKILDVGIYFEVSERTVNTWAHGFRNEGLDLIDRAVDGKYKPKTEKIKNKIIKEKAKEKQNKKNQNLIAKIEEQKLEISKLKELPPLKFEERLEIQKFKTEITSIKKDLREAERQALTSESLMGVIHETKNHIFGKPPEWLTPKTPKSKTHGIPCLFLSDIHFDEIVSASQIGFVNEYNRDIATKRIQHTFNTSIDILFNKTVNPKYDGMIIAFGGDMLSGNIHEELAETNEDSIQRSLLVLTDLLIGGIELHLKYFNNIFIPAVVGNHGRHHKKKRMKNKVFDNYEWLIYQYIKRYFKNDKRVTFLIPDGPDAHFNIYDKGFLLTHGDQFRGGSGISGIFTPLMLGRSRKQQKTQAIKKNFDVMMLGHFHQYIHTNQLIVNGSIKGYDEFANEFNFMFERPQQALFINHPDNGMVLRTPILCDSYENKSRKEVEKIVVLK